MSSIILIADDDPLYAEDLKTILGVEGHDDVLVARTCKHMLDLLEDRDHPDALILDMMLPWDALDASGGIPPENTEELRGLRAARNLKEMGYDLRRVLVITALHSKRANDLLCELGMDERNILLKPARTSEIISRLREACATPKT